MQCLGYGPTFMNNQATMQNCSNYQIFFQPAAGYLLRLWCRNSSFFFLSRPFSSILERPYLPHSPYSNGRGPHSAGFHSVLEAMHAKVNDNWSFRKIVRVQMHETYTRNGHPWKKDRESLLRSSCSQNSSWVWYQRSNPLHCKLLGSNKGFDSLGSALPARAVSISVQ